MRSSCLEHKEQNYGFQGLTDFQKKFRMSWEKCFQLNAPLSTNALCPISSCFQGRVVKLGGEQMGTANCTGAQCYFFFPLKADETLGIKNKFEVTFELRFLHKWS